MTGQHWQEQSGGPRGAGRRRPLWLGVVAVAAVALVLVALRGAGLVPDVGAGRGSLRVDPEAAAPTASPPSIATAPEVAARAPAVAGTWRSVPPAPLDARRDTAAVWTGPCARDEQPPVCGEILVWGGVADHNRRDGAAYDPTARTWRPLADAPVIATSLAGQPFTWTGRDPSGRGPARGELVVIGQAPRGPVSGGGGVELRGVAYDPVTDAWRELPPVPLAPRSGHSVVWTGRRLVVWGGQPAGRGGATAFLDGAVYDPVLDAWYPMAPAPLTPRQWPATAAGPGQSVVVWGGHTLADNTVLPLPLTDGAVYEPALDRWQLLPPLPARRRRMPTGRPAIAATDEDLVVHAALVDPAGREVLATYGWDGGRWLLRPRLPDPRADTGIASADDGVVIWGAGRPGRPWTAAAYDLESRRWTSLARPTALSPTGRAVVWTGKQLFVWGGWTPARALDDGAIWSPSAR